MSAELLPILLQGVLLGVGLCLTLGPQSLFVLRQGLRGDQALQVAAICALSDVVMVVAGASGSGALLAAFPSVRSLAAWGGAALVVACGVLQLIGSVLRIHEHPAPGRAAKAASCAIAPAIILSLLNPQVYLEMVGVVGGAALRFAEVERVAFACGVMLVSPLWFFGLALAGRRAAAVMRSRRAAVALDLAAASLMLGLGTAMALAEFGVR
ncbi:MAG TPA: LysE family transporter [Candidatus Acidoferrum sp.]|nr:LysE family transporter [Candidatus Acidoferrum sp.]